MRTPNNTTADFLKVNLSFAKLPSPTCLNAGNRKVKNVSYAFFKLLHYYIILRIYVCNFDSFPLLNFATIIGPFFDRFNISVGSSKNEVQMEKNQALFLPLLFPIKIRANRPAKVLLCLFFGISQ